MKNLKLIIGALIVLGIASCKKEYKVAEPSSHGGHGDMMNYEVIIMKPDSTMKMMDSNMHIHVNFSEANNKTVHHINVKIYQMDDPTNIIYDMPGDAHVHATSGLYEYHDDLILSAANGAIAHKNYIVEAKVWGHDAGAHEVTVTQQFHLHQL
jgi:hypothetical protein